MPSTKYDYKQHHYTPPTHQSEVRQYRGLESGQKTSQIRVFRQSEVLEFCDLVLVKDKLVEDNAYAQSLGYKDTLVPNGLLGGTVSDILGTKLPGRGTNWLKQKYLFLAPICPGEEITTTVEIIRLRPEKDLVNLRTTLTNQSGKIAVDGEALVWVSDLVAS